MLLKVRFLKGHRGSTSLLHLALSKRVIWSSMAVPATKLILGQGCRAKFDQWITVLGYQNRLSISGRSRCLPESQSKHCQQRSICSAAVACRDMAVDDSSMVSVIL